MAASAKKEVKKFVFTFVFMWLVPCIVLRNITINAKSLYKKSKIFFKNSFVTGHHHDKALQR
jgi:preprotein translocase subunit SecG